MSKHWLLGVALSVCVSCSTTPEAPSGANPEPRAPSNSASGAFTQGQIAIKDGDYRQAIEHFSRLRQEFPEDMAAPQALLGSGYAHYKMGNNDAAVDTSNAFIQSYQDHPLIDYAYYLRGLARYGEGIAQLENQQLNPNSRTTTARKAFEYFAEQVRRFPNSKYNQDARVRMEVLHSKLADHELGLANKALSLNKYQEAIARSDYIVKNYTRAETAPEAYSIMIDAFTALGDVAQAENVRRALARKYPDYQHNDTDRSSGTQVTRVDPDKLKQRNNRAPGSVTILPLESQAQTPIFSAEDQAEEDSHINLITPNTADPSTLANYENTKGVKREDWYLSQPSSSYTLQLLGTNDETSLEEYIEEHQISDQAGYFLSQNAGNDWYTLTYGLYRSKNEALLAIEGLSAALREPNPWVRPISDIQVKLKKP